MNKLKILIIDDEPSISRALKIALQADGHSVETALSGRVGLNMLKNCSPDAVILDLRLPDIDGMQIIDKIKEFSDGIITIVITAFGDTKTAVEAIKRGAYDFITKPFDLNEIKLSLERAVRERALEAENELLKLNQDKTVFITRDKKVLDILSQLDAIAQSDSNVLIEGETGTGKELVARMIHEKSRRSSGPLVTINCSAIPGNLFESELFGHEKNAFTGAGERKKGLFELANGGSLFLDEMGELPLELQSKLLRVLEDRKIRRVGGLSNLPVNVRIISATNKDLKAEVERGNFRRDLFYRICVFHIKIPPLRKRRCDIIPLLEYYRTFFNRQFKKNITGFSEGALRILQNYYWPGNVRELKNILERAFILARKNLITEYELPMELKSGRTESTEISESSTFLSLEDMEKRHIKDALERTHWNITKAAELLGISRFALQRRMKKYFPNESEK
ncbi:sigma-54-dependent transcriptional regulator [Thermosediminibacter oceani]|uniref:Stage 0 sporulation protein A homolog n=1 Tax=Thermosediminibacter oceani (strain ATCC BAA-1034 / DSM 16646 / JW/IW-1228P) TaxID=555079 RepID=D9RZ21_THEOJ|nr:sigma-54 dependent transcriptional regulator [Thermosediminibacter oceani]ADL08575.1 two component, sigma54 specific, transcriptional regulator, Fis family [Thermosediminibacter oceani DSM 16646]